LPVDIREGYDDQPDWGCRLCTNQGFSCPWVLRSDSSESASSGRKPNEQGTVTVENARGAGLHAILSWQEGDAKAMPLSDGEFDLVVFSGSLHHWEDPLVVLDEIARVLREGGGYLVRDSKRLAARFCLGDQHDGPARLAPALLGLDPVLVHRGGAAGHPGALAADGLANCRGRARPDGHQGGLTTPRLVKGGSSVLGRRVLAQHDQPDLAAAPVGTRDRKEGIHTIAPWLWLVAALVPVACEGKSCQAGFLAVARDGWLCYNLTISPPGRQLAGELLPN
jgi:hypothetical protein